MGSKHRERLQGIFEHAVALEDHARHEYLNQECKNDHKLLTQVSNLLAAHTKPESSVEDSPVSSIDFGQVEFAQSKIGPYQIIGKLGSGGMGEVFKALDLRLDRHVALKFLPPNLSADTKAKKRLIREAKAASALDHQNICTVYDIGETADNQFYIAMAFCQGNSINKIIAKGPIELNQTIDITCQITDGMGAAHKKGIFHRDIKPANLILSNDGKLTIVDFGIAKIANVNNTDTAIQSGTIAYMSPEQIKGEKADHRSDIWSTAVILFEMITGKKPFNGDTLPEVMYHIVNDNAPSLSNFSENYAHKLDDILSKALQKEPGKRYQSMSDFARDLKRLRISESTIKKQKTAESKSPLVTPYLNQPFLDRPGTVNGISHAAAIAIEFSNYATIGSQCLNDEFKTLLLDYFSSIEKCVAEHGGIINAVHGDTVTSVFGIPLLEAADIENALHASIAIQTKVKKLSEQHKVNINCHIGVATGQLYSTGLIEDHFVGEAINLALRLDDLCQPGDIFVSDEVRCLIVEEYQTNKVTELTTRKGGKSIVVWQVVENQKNGKTPIDEISAKNSLIGDNPKEIYNTGEHVIPPVFQVNRKKPLDHFEDIIATCIEQSQGHVAHIQGVAGIGKSWFANNLSEYAITRGFNCHQASNYYFGSTDGQQALQTIIRSLLNSLFGNTQTAEQKLIGVAFEKNMITEAQLPFLYDLLGLSLPKSMSTALAEMSYSERMHQLNNTAISICQTMAADTPQLFLIENLQFATKEMVAQFEALIKGLANHRIIMLFTSENQSPFINLFPRKKQNNSTSALSIFNIAPLSKTDINEWVNSTLELPDKIKNNLTLISQGNPLFLSHSLQYLSANSIADLPYNFKDLLLQILACLETDDRLAIQAASVVGQRFTQQVIKYLINSQEYHFDNLEKGGFIETAGYQSWFSHELIQQAIYESLDSNVKREYHLRAAEWFSYVDSTVRAEHLDRAGNPSTAAAYFDAAKTQHTVFHLDHALRLAKKGLALVQTDGEFYQFNNLLGDITLGLGDTKSAMTYYQTILNVEMRDEYTCHALVGIARCCISLNHHSDAVGALQQAETIALQYAYADALNEIEELQQSLENKNKKH